MEHQATGTAIGEMLGIPGNGKRICFRMLHIREFRDARMSRENVWLDSAAIAAQLAPRAGPSKTVRCSPSSPRAFTQCRRGLQTETDLLPSSAPDRWTRRHHQLPTARETARVTVLITHQIQDVQQWLNSPRRAGFSDRWASPSAPS
jgi:hypothetical protein